MDAERQQLFGLINKAVSDEAVTDVKKKRLAEKAESLLIRLKRKSGRASTAFACICVQLAAKQYELVLSHYFNLHRMDIGVKQTILFKSSLVPQREYTNSRVLAERILEEDMPFTENQRNIGSNRNTIEAQRSKQDQIRNMCTELGYVELAAPIHSTLSSFESSWISSLSNAIRLNVRWEERFLCYAVGILLCLSNRLGLPKRSIHSRVMSWMNSNVVGGVTEQELKNIVEVLETECGLKMDKAVDGIRDNTVLRKSPRKSSRLASLVDRNNKDAPKTPTKSRTRIITRSNSTGVVVVAACTPNRDNGDLKSVLRRTASVGTDTPKRVQWQMDKTTQPPDTPTRSNRKSQNTSVSTLSQQQNRRINSKKRSHHEMEEDEFKSISQFRARLSTPITEISSMVGLIL